MTITRDDVLKYLELDKAGYSHELAYSRALTIADVNKRIAHIENGHNRAYAAARCGIGIPVYDLLLQDQENEAVEPRTSCRTAYWQWQILPCMTAQSVQLAIILENLYIR